MMIRFHPIIFIICLVIPFILVNDVGAASIKFSKIEDSDSKQILFRLLFYENENVIAEREYKNGKLITSKGQIPNKISNAIQIKVIKQNKTDSKTAERGFIYLQNNKILAKRINKNGKTLSEGEIPNGTIIEYYKNGEIRNIFIHRDGKRNGPAISLYEDGTIKGEAFYKDDFPTGIGRRYFKNGNLMAEWNIVDGKDVFHKEYHENGQIREEVYNQNDKIIRKTYDINGKMIGEAIYKTTEAGQK